MNERDDLKAYLDGELDARRRADIERSLAADPALRQELDELRRLSAAVQALPQPVAQGLEQTLWQLQRLSAPKPSARPWFQWAGVGLAGAAAVVVALAVLFPRNGSGLANADQAEVVMAPATASKTISEPNFDDAEIRSRSTEQEKKRPATTVPNRASDTASPVTTPPPAQVQSKVASVFAAKSLERAKDARPQDRAAAKKPAPGMPAAKIEWDQKPTETLKEPSHVSSATGAPLAVRADDVEKVRSRLVQLVHRYKGTIYLGQAKGQPLTANVQIPEEFVGEFERAVALLASQSEKAQFRGLGGGGFGAGSPGADSANRGSGESAITSPSPGRKEKPTQPGSKRRITIHILPANE